MMQSLKGNPCAEHTTILNSTGAPREQALAKYLVYQVARKQGRLTTTAENYEQTDKMEDTIPMGREQMELQFGETRTKHGLIQRSWTRRSVT